MEKAEATVTPIISQVLPDGRLVELVYDQEMQQTSFVVGNSKSWSMQQRVELTSKATIIPYGPDNNLIAHQVVLLPSKPEEYASTHDLVNDIRSYIYKYVDLPSDFELAACYYILFSWVYDKFQEVPYLRFTGDYGTGKTRFLLIVGSLLYRPIFASGASTVSPIFHGLNSFRGTLVMDEADFRFSDEKSEVVKILNNGNVKGFVLLRSEMNHKTKEYNPKAFNVFGPKLIVTRGAYEDQALESRFISCTSSGKKLRADIPINLSEAYKAEALQLRNKLLLWRLKNHASVNLKPELRTEAVEARINQVYLPLLSVIDDPEHREIVASYANDSQQDLMSMRDDTTEASVLTTINTLAAHGSTRISVKDIATAYEQQFSQEVSSRWVGSIIRQKLHLKTERIGGSYYLTQAALKKLPALYQRFGIEQIDPFQDFQDF